MILLGLILLRLVMGMQKWCKACVLLDGLNRGQPRLGITRTRGKGSANGAEIVSRKPSVSSIDF